MTRRSNWISAFGMAFAVWALAGGAAGAQTPSPPSSPASTAGPQAGAFGRTLGLGTICDTCVAELFTDSCPGRLEAPVFGPDGSLWAVGVGESEIYRISADRKCSVVAHTPRPLGLRFRTDGRLYGVDATIGLFWIDTQTMRVTPVTNTFNRGAFHGVDDLIFDKAGGIYMTDAYGSSALDPQGQVFYVAPDGQVRRLIQGHLAFPNGIALSPDERVLYIDDWGTNRIFAVPVTGPGVINIDGAYVFAYLNGGHGPDSMTVDKDGNIYAAHWGAGEVVVFDPHGFFFGAIRLPDTAGLATSNVALHDGYLYVTEQSQHAIWRVKTKISGLAETRP